MTFRGDVECSVQILDGGLWGRQGWARVVKGGQGWSRVVKPVKPLSSVPAAAVPVQVYLSVPRPQLQPASQSPVP